MRPYTKRNCRRKACKAPLGPTCSASKAPCKATKKWRGGKISSWGVLMTHIYKPFIQITQSPNVIKYTSAPLNFEKIVSSRLFKQLPETIQNTIKTHTYSSNSTAQNIHFTNGHTATVFLVLYDSAENADIILQKVRGWLEFVSSFSNPKCSQHLDVYLVLTDEKKRLPESSETLIGPEHANTAFTYACVPNNQIFVYRREEWLKVFMHETFHAFGLDFATAPNEINNQCNHTFQKLFPRIEPGTDIRIYETYCEVWAEILQVLFSSGGKISTFTRSLAEEQKFAIKQAQKVLRHSGITYSELMMTPSGDDGKTYTEITSVLSYYVIRAAILLNIDKFVQFCFHSTKTERMSLTEKPFILQFHITNPNIEKYCQFVRDCCVDKKFVRAMETTHEHDYTNTLRMTAK